MAILIDGYNLIHGANLVGRGVGPGGLERARQALLDLLRFSLTEVELRRTTVVFDAGSRGHASGRSFEYHGIRIRFSAGYEDADELIEELIRQDSSPRRLTVVSSDHRLHRAARKRRAEAIDSDVWYAQLIRRRLQTRPQDQPPPPTSTSPLTPEEIEAWQLELNHELKQLDDVFPRGYGDDVDED